MANMNYNQGGSGGYGVSSSPNSYDPVSNVAFSALNNYNSNAQGMNDYLSQMIASNQAAAKQAQNAQTQQMQNQQNTAAAAAGPGGAMQGASMGSMFGPWGAAAGAIIGGAAGSWKDFQNKQSQGGNWLSNLGSTAWDAINPVNSYNAIMGQGSSPSTGAAATKALSAFKSPTTPPAQITQVPGAYTGMGGVGQMGTPTSGQNFNLGGQQNPQLQLGGQQYSNYQLPTAQPGYQMSMPPQQNPFGTYNLQGYGNTGGYGSGG